MAEDKNKKPFWDINYAYEDAAEGSVQKPVLGIVPPVARGTKAHESRKILAEEKPVLPLPKRSSELDKDEITRLLAAKEPIIPGVPPKE